jgi:hypothetical protein
MFVDIIITIRCIDDLSTFSSDYVFCENVLGD